MLELPIQSRRVILRRHEERDRAAFIELVTDPRFREHLRMPPRQRTRRGASEVFDTIVRSYGTDEPVWGLTVAERESDAFVGTVALHPIPFGETLELFYATVIEEQGQGFATEAVRALMNALPARDFVALTAPDNTASKKVALAAGMRDDGLHEPLGGPSRHRFVRAALSPQAH